MAGLFSAIFYYLIVHVRALLGKNTLPYTIVYKNVNATHATKNGQVLPGRF